MPCISVIVPIYRAEEYVARCVESVQKQTFSDWELLLIDDGSPDSSGRICDALAARDDRLRVFHKENGGVSTARNRGLEEARGTCVAFLDADDRYEPRMLETLWNARECAGADTAACAHWNLLPDGSKQAEQVLPEGGYDAAGIRERIVYPLLGDRLAQPVFNGFVWRYLYDGELLRRLGLRFEGAYLEDEIFLMEYFCNARKLAVTAQPLYDYYLNPSSVTHKYMADFSGVFARFLERKEALAKQYGLESARPRWRENTNWAGLLIAVGNEYARSNPAGVRQKQRAVEALCARPEMAKAIAELEPRGLSKNKQLAAELIRGKHFFTLTLLYRLKNRI